MILTGPDIKIHLELATFFTQEEVASSHQTALKLPVLRADNFFKFVQIELVDANPLPASTITLVVTPTKPVFAAAGKLFFRSDTISR